MAKKSQIEKFRATAREIEADDDAKKFDKALRRMAKGSRKAANDMADQLGMADSKKDFGRKRGNN